MRGAVSLAAALAIPLTTDAGDRLPRARLILFLTLTTIGVTLSSRASTLPVLIRRLGVEDTRPSDAPPRHGALRHRPGRARRTSPTCPSRAACRAGRGRARARHVHLARAAAGRPVPDRRRGRGGRRRGLGRPAPRADRGRAPGAARLRDEGRIPNRVVLEVERDLDLEESRLDSRPFQAPVEARSERRSSSTATSSAPTAATPTRRSRRCAGGWATRLTFEFRHFPIEQKHPHALQAAEAAEAARAQGRFEEMHDLLFENQRRLERDDLVGYARAARPGRRALRARADAITRTSRRSAPTSAEAASQRGVAGTPTLLHRRRALRGLLRRRTAGRRARS